MGDSYCESATIFFLYDRILSSQMAAVGLGRSTLKFLHTA
jgi:hypothetical protein